MADSEKRTDTVLARNADFFSLGSLVCMVGSNLLGLASVGVWAFNQSPINHLMGGFSVLFMAVLMVITVRRYLVIRRMKESSSE